MTHDTSGYTDALNGLTEMAGKLARMQVDLVNNGIKSATSIVEPLGKTSIGLVENAFDAVNQVLQSVSSAIAPKE